MRNQDEPTPQFEPTISPPNGERVTAAALYKALYDLDLGLSARQTVILEAINDGADRTAQLRTDLETHRSDGHPYTVRAEIAKAEMKLDAKKAAVLGALLTLTTAVVTYVGAMGGLPF